jgi:hypothetical protein
MRVLSAESGRFTKMHEANDLREHVPLAGRCSTIRFPNMILNETQHAVRGAVRAFARDF